jgi:hypothetical protein
MKQYTKHYENSTNGVNTPVERTSAGPRGGEKAVRSVSSHGLSHGGLLNTHVLTNRDKELRDDFLENCYKEWEQWLQDYRLRQLQRTPPQPFTITDFENLAV